MKFTSRRADGVLASFADTPSLFSSKGRFAPFPLEIAFSYLKLNASFDPGEGFLKHIFFLKLPV